MAQQERRKKKRIKKTFYALLRPYDSTATWVSATIRDISESGLCAFTQSEFPLGEELDIKIQALDAEGPKKINIRGNVVESKKEGVGYCLRIVFTKYSDEDRNSLTDIIESFSKGEQR
ncbi:MAG: PilZ domain-containing protein [Candidatus Omnitrophica bacterium]|nr:PilZ domain-containing protein [Candidatus Omnitrophota bacterium]